eukprot:TRINITY_DN156_c0_g2_i1.p1 TRINITY_DN156_c0_g2~~TRINITY_DN156_c0_g2_i1.p1  ORF type:complete len:173 (-),score=65.50 TRINITY_DN156_c0_g2_i1:160-678(-)
MKIYKDIFSGDELFSDTYKMKLVDDCLYEIYGKHITRTDDEVKLDGANASAEEAEEGCDVNSVSGIDIVLNHRLTATGFGSKKDYMTYLKGYMAKVTKHMEENGKKDQVDSFKANINKVMKELLGRFKDLEFYCGESMDPDAMVLILDYKEVDGVEHPVFLAFKDGLDEEKC